MKFRLSLLGALLIAAAIPVAQAQTPSTDAATPPPTGESSTPKQDQGAMPVPAAESRSVVETPMAHDPSVAQSRAEVRADAIAASKAGMTASGERSTKNQDRGGVER